MRLWHKDLIPYLPRQQLIAQWRECCAIAGSIAKKGTPNHILVNKIMNYSSLHFHHYVSDVYEEMLKRGYKVSRKKAEEISSLIILSDDYFPNETPAKNKGKVFKNWHNDRYLKQCLFNLQEKYDCGGIPENEWKRIEEKFGEYLK